jgi:D-alanyl-D-alanine carboxypeptidase/D-alanyl-D-alanine-endopeptidase (penicillin-binding protein 4)
VGLMAAAPLAVAAGASGQAPAGVAAGPALQQVVDSVMSTPPLDRVHWGIAVVDARTGEPLLRRNANRLFIPASNMKLVTAAAAMERLGPDHRFTTTLVAWMTPDGVADSLVVTGSGDPTLRKPFHDPPLAPLDSLADSLAAAGVRRVAGPLVVDQRRFEARTVHPAWEVFDLDWYYAAPVAPFAVTAAAHEVVITPGAVGSPARIELPFARDLVEVDARVRTVRGGRPWNDELRRGPLDSLVLRGTIGAAAGPDTSWIAQTDPGRTAGTALAHALEAVGIPATGPVRVRYRLLDPVAPTRDGDGPAEEREEVRIAWRSPPLEQVIPLILERSDNWISEQLLKALGAEGSGIGSWDTGSDVLERYLTGTVGVDPGEVYLRDGSGLTAQNLITPDALAALLVHVREQPWAATFRAAMVQPGEDEGTLEDRLPALRERVWAKTGTIRHVNALSGFVLTADGRELVFSILSNGSGRPSSDVRRAIDRIVHALIEHGS